MNPSDIDLNNKTATLFSATAESAANWIGDAGKKNRSNKSTQLRGFYDEIVAWDARARQVSEEDFKAEMLPLVHMLIAKTAYAFARKHVTDEFNKLMRRLIGQIETRANLRDCKTFMEAFMGFYKLHGPK